MKDKHDSSRGRKSQAIMSWDDLVSMLLWPRLLEATRLSLRPARLGLALVVVVAVGLIGRIPELWLKGPGPLNLASELAVAAAARIGGGVGSLDFGETAAGLGALFIGVPGQVGRAFPWSSLVILVPIVVIWTVGGGAIARMAATEFSRRERLSWTQGLGFAVSRWGSLVSAKLAPLALAGLVTVGLAVAGWALLQVPYLQIIGGVLYFLAMLAGAAIVLLLVGFLIAMPLVVPALACEGADAIDAVQRSYAYVFARPLRVVLYLLVLLVQVVIVTAILAALAAAVIVMTARCTTLFTGAETTSLVMSQAAFGMQGASDGGDASGFSGRTTGALLGFWNKLPLLLVASYVVSFWFSGGTVSYLLIRQVCDGQDVGELWSPGMIAGAPPPQPAAGADPDENDDE